MIQRSKDIEKQERRRKIEESRYAAEYREIANEKRKTYLQEGTVKKKNLLETLGRFRLGTEAKANRYWMKEEEKICRLCKESKETLKHIIEECRITGDSSKNWKEVIRDDGRHIATLHGILWKRKREELKEKVRAEQSEREEAEMQGRSHS